MRLYTANCIGDAKNTYYPNCVEVQTDKDLYEALKRDHMASNMKGNRRHTDNFLGCDCLMFDVDNSHSDDPSEWLTEGDIYDALPFDFYLVRSRNYMKEKRKVDKATGAVTITEPREKWHGYLPLRKTITDAGEFARLMKNVLCILPYLDPAAIDTARFFYGVPDPYITGAGDSICIDEYMAFADLQELRQSQERNIRGFAEKIKSGDYKDNKYTRLVVATGCEFLGISNPLAAVDQRQDQAPSAANAPDVPDWIRDADQRRAIKWLENWANQNDVVLGRRYTIPETSQAHAGAIAICVTCPWEHEHSAGNWPDNESVILVERTGKLDYVCRHSHGAALSWRDYRAACERSKGDNAGQEPQSGATDQRQAGPTQQTPRPDSVLDYINNHMGDDIEGFSQEIKTGFKEFDRVAGGLYPGLYVIGGGSSVGKTTFCAQLADMIAAGGNDVLYFSMEQTRLELVTKSITRTIAQKAMNGGPRHVPNSLDIRRGYMPEAVLSAAQEYAASVGDRLSIIEGIFDCTIGRISEYVDAYIKATGRRPVVFVDYLQVLQPTDQEGRRPQTAKDVTDEAVKELKRLAHREKTPVIVISSLNRANYLLPIDFESFKESGGIEYTCDVLLGLQFRVLRNPEFEKIKTITEKRDRMTKEKNGKPRKLELICLKNRYGRLYACGFDYYAEFDLVREVNRDFADFAPSYEGADVPTI